MSLRAWIITSILIIFIQFGLSSIDLFSLSPFILLVSWLFINFYQPKIAYLFIFFGGTFLELLSYRTIGLYPLTFIITLLILYFLKRYINILSEENMNQVSLLGLTLNLVLYYVVVFLVNLEFNLPASILGVIFLILLFIIIQKVGYMKSSNKYET
jgi:hypothetical protein